MELLHTWELTKLARAVKTDRVCICTWSRAHYIYVGQCEVRRSFTRLLKMRLGRDWVCPGRSCRKTTYLKAWNKFLGLEHQFLLYQFQTLNLPALLCMYLCTVKVQYYGNQLKKIRNPISKMDHGSKFLVWESLLWFFFLCDSNESVTTSFG